MQHFMRDLKAAPVCEFWSHRLLSCKTISELECWDTSYDIWNEAAEATVLPVETGTNATTNVTRLHYNRKSHKQRAQVAHTEPRSDDPIAFKLERDIHGRNGIRTRVHWTG